MKIRRLSSLLSMVVLITFILNIAVMIPASAAAASLSLYASKRTVSVGETFTVSAAINTGGVSINAASATISFDPAKLAVTGVSRGSVFSLWAEEPSYSNSRGTVTGSGGLPTPGYNGNGGVMMRMTFKALATGNATVRYASGSLLANDGLGTNIVAGLDTVTVSVQERVEQPPTPSTPTTPAPTPKPTTPAPPGSVTVAPAVSSLSHPDAATWYKDNRPMIIWDVPAGVEGISATIDAKPESDPGTNSIGLFNFFTAKEALADGIWYGHVRLKYKSGWSPVGHRILRIDSTAPVIAQAKILSRGGNDRVLEFAVSDAISSVTRVAISMDGQQLASEASSPFALPVAPGDHAFEVTAYDEAGNRGSTRLFMSVLTASGGIASLFSNGLAVGLLFMNLVFLAIIALMEWRYHQLMHEVHPSGKRKRLW